MATAARVPSKTIKIRKQITKAVAQPELLEIVSVALKHAVDTSITLWLLTLR